MFKKLLQLINKPIGYVSIPCKNADSALFEEFFNMKNKIMAENYRSMMVEKFIPFVRKEAIARGYLKADYQCFNEAHNLFMWAKKEGFIDELNSFIEISDTLTPGG